jgi:NADPH:quinone reductase-like Zn-dependent oxidoreductase
MKAIVCTDYGPPNVLRLRDVPKPVPKDNEVLVRIRATTVSAADCELRRFDFAPWIWVAIRLAFGIRRPRQPVFGQELAGDVDSVGKDVKSLEPGDQVFAATGLGLGAYAEYICLRENPATGATTMPANLSYEEAAVVPYGGGEALQFLRKANVRSGQRVLVNGAGGSFGTFAVQLAKDLGAHVTAVDSAPKLEMLRTIGADRVIDYSQEDFTESHETYDVILDVVRNTPSGRMVRLLTENGCLLMAQSELPADRSRQVGVEGEQKAGVIRGIGANERGPGVPARLGRSGTAAPCHRPAVPARADGRGAQVRRIRPEAGDRRCRRRIEAGRRLRW